MLASGRQNVGSHRGMFRRLPLVSMPLVGSLCAWLMATPAEAQSLTGSVRGTVSDTTGAVVPGASVTLANQRTREQRNTVTDARGGFFFAAVMPSVYTLRVELTGFRRHEVKDIGVSANDARGVDVTLQPGGLTETVTVTSETEIIQTETGAREGLINAKQIDNLSIIGRSALELLRIMPGVVAPDGNQLESVSFLQGSNNTQGYTVNGVRSSSNVVTLDGSRLIDIGSNNGLILSPNNDMVQEVKIQASNYAAEFGSSGMQISAVTKGGGSEFHGTVYDYLRHNKFAANDRSNTIARTDLDNDGKVDKPKSKYNYVGGNLSGPILIPGTDFNKGRDKAFFFLGFELQRQDVDSGSTFGVVPTLGQRRGNFNDTIGGQNLNQPTSVLIPQGFPGAGSPAPNNDLSPYIDPVGRALMGLYPLPNYRDPNNRYNYVYSALEPTNRNEFTARLDYNFSESTRAYVRLSRQKEERDWARGVWWNASNYELPTPTFSPSLGRSASLNVISVISPSITNEVLVTWSKLNLDNRHKDPQKISLEALGIGSLRGPFGQVTKVAPVQIYDWGGQAEGSLWTPMGQDVFAYNASLQLSDTLTKVLNTHALKFGVSVEKVDKDQNFQNDEHLGVALGPGWIPGSTGSSYGDLLVGRPAQIESGTLIPNGAFELWNVDAFVQDSWKIKPNFTLEYGIRASWMPNNTEQQGLGAVFLPARYDPSKSTFVDDQFKRLNGVAYAATGDVPKHLIDNRPVFVMPRLNFAWDIEGNGKTVLRGGGGVFYNRPMGNAEYDVIRIPPNAYHTSLDAWTGSNLGDGRGLTFSTMGEVDPRTLIGRIGVDTVNPDSRDYPRYFTTSLSLARRIPFQQVLEAGYVGTFGRHLLNRRQTNVIQPGTLQRGAVGNSDLSVPVNRVALDGNVVNTFRPFPALANVNLWEYAGTSNYHSLQVTLSRQTGKRLQYFATYTFSKVLGTVGDEYQGLDPFEPRQRSYGILDSDRTHIGNLSYNYQAPDLAPSSFNNSVTRFLLNGWQISGISSWASGKPIYLGFGGDIGGSNMRIAWYGTPDIGGSGGFANRGAITPILVRNPQLGGKSAGEKLFDVGAIQIPGFGESGAFQQPFYLRSPSVMNHDVTLFKNFAVGKNGDRKIQFRAGFFNLFNQAFAGRSSDRALLAQDIDLSLNTTCNRRLSGVPNGAGGTGDNVCDPTGGFSLTQNTIDNFGKIKLLRGHRVIEFALKFYF